MLLLQDVEQASTQEPAIDENQTATSNCEVPQTPQPPTDCTGDTKSAESSADIEDISDALKLKCKLNEPDDVHSTDGGKKQEEESPHDDDECFDNSDWDVESFEEDDTNDFVQYAINGGSLKIADENEEAANCENNDEEEEVVLAERVLLDEEWEDFVDSSDDDSDDEDAAAYEFPQREFDTIEEMQSYYQDTQRKVEKAQDQIELINEQNRLDNVRVFEAWAMRRSGYARQVMVRVETPESM